MRRLHAFFHPETVLDATFLLSLFFALGIWLVVQRYKTIRDRAVLFYWPPPDEARRDFASRILTNPHFEKSHENDPSLLPPAAPRDRDFITCFDPATGMHLSTLMADSKGDIERKIAAAEGAQKIWAYSTFPERKRVVKSLKRWLVENQDVCARVACRDSGMTFIDAALGEIMTTCSKLDWLLSHGARVLQPEARHSNLMYFYKQSEVHFEPLGVVAAIVSWNRPLYNAWSPILAALFSGNAIVLKCSEHVIWSTTWFVGAIKECLRACQIDPDLVQLVSCLPKQTETLTTSPLIKHITFIGSKEVGRKVAIAATENLTPVTLELGGKDPAIILPGTDIERWSSTWMRGIFQNAGQNCVGIDRLIVHSSQYDELYDIICKRAKELRFGPVLAPPADGFLSAADCGSLISTARFDDLVQILDNAEGQGASLEGGRIYDHRYFASGAYFQATVVGNPPPGSRVTQRELFAPIAVLQSYEAVEEAIDLANGTDYGLGASVYGPDQSYCLQVAKNLVCGMVSINDSDVFYLNQDLPFGGTKKSGYGRSAGPEGLRSLTNPKAIVVDRFPWLIQTTIPRILDYPIQSMNLSWDFVSGLTGALYADGWRARARWLVQLVKAYRSSTAR